MAMEECCLVWGRPCACRHCWRASLSRSDNMAFEQVGRVPEEGSSRRVQLSPAAPWHARSLVEVLPTGVVAVCGRTVGRLSQWESWMRGWMLIELPDCCGLEPAKTSRAAGPSLSGGRKTLRGVWLLPGRAALTAVCRPFQHAWWGLQCGTYS